MPFEISALVPDAQDFGPYGGRFVPETLVSALEELEQEYQRARTDPEFCREFSSLLADYCGRPTPLYLAERLTRRLGGAKIYLKREDLLHTGAHKINNAIGQAILLVKSTISRSPASSHTTTRRKSRSASIGNCSAAIRSDEQVCHRLMLRHGEGRDDFETLKAVTFLTSLA